MGAHPLLTNNVLKQSWAELLEAEKQLKFRWSELNREVNLRYQHLVPDWQRDRLSGELQSKRERFLKDSQGLREQAAQIKKSYDELSRDEAIKEALKAMKQSTKSRIDLGPSPEFKKKASWLLSAEKTTAPDSFPRRKGRSAGPAGAIRKNVPKSKRAAAPASKEPSVAPN
jgi:hypothetical protein